MSNYTGRYEWQGDGFISPKPICKLCGQTEGRFNRLFWAGSYMNGDDDYVLDLCVLCFKNKGEKIKNLLDKMDIGREPTIQEWEVIVKLSK